MTKDYYDILGVAKTATEDEIKSKYRKLAMQYHPDKNVGDKSAEQKFKDINEAYDVLKDPEKRRMYDSGAYNPNGPSGGGFNPNDFDFGTFDGMFDIFGDMFGNRRRGSSGQSVKGSDLLYNLSITLEDAFLGATKDININTLCKCDVCNGSGADGIPEYVLCGNCSGSGRIRIRKGFFITEQLCSKCSGMGKTIKNPCGTCKGQGRYKRNRILNVKIPAGVSDGMRIRLSQEGEAGGPGAQPGDLYIQVGINHHKIFEVDGHNLHVGVTLDMATAALGGVITMNTIDGKKLDIKIPDGIATGQSIRIKGKGMSILNKNSFGDLYLDIFVKTPTKLSKEQKKVLDNLFRSKEGFTIQSR